MPRFKAHPTCGNWRTAPDVSVTCANTGTVHEPVSSAFPPKLAVPILVFVYAVGMDARSPPNVDTLAPVDAVEAGLALVPPVVRLKGEHPTKLGADELTAAHSWTLNCMAAESC